MINENNGRYNEVNEHDEIVFKGIHPDEDELYVDWDTVTGPDGKEYPIRDRD